MSTFDPFDPAKGEAAKQEAMDRVERSADPAWSSFMLAALVEVAHQQPHLNTDDIERLRIERQGPSTHENRALGPLMKQAQKGGICEPTDQWIPSSQIGNHRRPMRVWRSLIYQASPPPQNAAERWAEVFGT